LLEVLADEREDIRPRDDFGDRHPQYRKFVVDPEPPLLEAPPQPEPKPTLDWRQLQAEHHTRTGKDLKPIGRRADSYLPPAGARCERCSAPEQFLYVNDGKVGNQLRCKVCGLLFPSHRCRRESNARYWCPHCGWALYRWKHEPKVTIYKCPNDHCSCYTANVAKLNERERALQQTGMSSQFKLCYQYREYHVSPAALRTASPQADTIDLSRVRNDLHTVGLALAYSVSFGLSNRMTAEILRSVHNIRISRQTVDNYQKAAALLAHRFTEKHLGELRDRQLAGDETYIRVEAEWQYTWFVIGARTRAIRAWHISATRDALEATTTLNSAIRNLADEPTLPIEFIADGNPAYDLAVHIINAEADGRPRPLQRRTVIGLTNEDDESEQFRPLKQLIERLNRTYKFHTRARAGFKNPQGAVALTALFVAYYNFLRPHGALLGRVPVPVPELAVPDTLQERWLKLLEMAA
ncbi:MAG: DDE-type integrase/transposase/recombinase, partial [candidate division NC10 bacterium]